MRRDIAPRAEAERLRRLCDAHGFTAAKWRVGAECGRDVDEWPGGTEEVVPVVATALGEGVAKLVDVVQPDVMYLGGLVRTLEVVRMAQASGIPCTPHSANRSLVTVAAMHLLAAIPNAGPYLELSIAGPDECPWQDGLFVDDPCGVEDGLVRVPDAPGRDVEVSPAWPTRATRTVSTTN